MRRRLIQASALTALTVGLLAAPARASDLCPCTDTQSLIRASLDAALPPLPIAHVAPTGTRSGDTAPKDGWGMAWAQALRVQDQQLQELIDQARDMIQDGFEQLEESMTSTMSENEEESAQQQTDVTLQQMQLNIALQEQVQRQEATMRRQALSYEASRDTSIQTAGLCQSAMAATGMGSAAEIAAATRASVSRDYSSRRSGSVPQFRGPAVAVASFVASRHEELFCDEGSAAETGCTPNEEDPRMQGADTSAESLLSYGTLDENMREAAQVYCENMVSALPPQSLSRAQAATPAGVSFRVARMNYDARIAAADYYCALMIGNQAEMSAESDDGEINLREWADDVLPAAQAAGVSGVNPEAEGISITDLMRIEIQRRFGNFAWLRNDLTRDGTEVNLIREIVIMSALNSYLDFERHRLRQVVGLNLAGINSTMASMELRRAQSTAGTNATLNTDSSE